MLHQHHAAETLQGGCEGPGHSQETLRERGEGRQGERERERDRERQRSSSNLHKPVDIWACSAGQTASTESLQDTLTLETITGVSSVSYWNANLSEFANAELAPPLNVTDGNRSSIEAGQVTVSGEAPCERSETRRLAHPPDTVSSLCRDQLLAVTRKNVFTSTWILDCSASAFNKPAG